MPEENIKQLEEVKRMCDNFLAHQADSDEAETALEIRGTALVLAGLLPPFVTPSITSNSISKVLENADSLFPQRALMTGWNA